jgi:hypothetical protein
LQNALDETPPLRPRLCRALLGSARYNFEHKHPLAALSRLDWFLRLAGLEIFRPAFWQKVRKARKKQLAFIEEPK